MAVDDWLTEIGGGLHCKRPVLRALRACIARRERSLLPVAHKDRPCRFGFDGFEYFAETHDCEIRVVHTFSGRPDGLRRHGQKIREAATDGWEGHAHPAQPGAEPRQVRPPGRHGRAGRTGAG
ncbi:MAG: hypothetical protein OXC13_06570 [Caldilineaceae bacterium]|nr:hypothetical protein [Caldilineaceae bacterium]